MKRGRKIIVSVATSADGYIARPDGDVAWLDRPRASGNYGMSAFLRSIDTILWGRKTYEIGLKLSGGTSVPNMGFDPKIRSYVFSRRPSVAPAPGFTFVSEPVGAFARRLRATPGKHVWIMGGAGIIASFLDAGEIDEFIIQVIPILIGSGIPLIEPRHRLVRLELLSSRRFVDGAVRLHYAVASTAERNRPKRAPRRPRRDQARIKQTAPKTGVK